MRMQDVMTGPVVTVPPITTAEDAWNLMQTRGIHHLVVVDGREIVGVLSDRDAGGRNGAAVRKNRTVADLMSAPVVTVTRTTTVRRAANLMRGRSIGCLVVAEPSGVLGMVTVADPLALIGVGVEPPIVTTKRRTLSHRAPHRKRHASDGAW